MTDIKQTKNDSADNLLPAQTPDKQDNENSAASDNLPIQAPSKKKLFKSKLFTKKPAKEKAPARDKKLLPIWQVAVVLVASIVLISCFKHDRLSSYWQQTYQQDTVWSMLETLPFWSKGVVTEQVLNTDNLVNQLSKIGDEGNAKLNEIFYADILERNRQIKLEKERRLAQAKEAARLEAARRERERLIIKEVTLSVSQKVFFAGDSMMQGVAPWAMRELQSRYQIASIDLSKQSTGLSYSSFFDWPATVEQTITDNPDIGVMVMFLGANDAWAVPDPEGGGKPYIKFNTPEWNALYSKKINRILQTAEDNQVQVMWLTPPAMKAEKLRDEMASLTQLYHDVIPNTKALVIDSKPLLHDASSSEDYTDTIQIDGKQVKVRTADGIHFTTSGQKRLAEEIVSHIKVIPDTP